MPLNESLARAGSRVVLTNFGRYRALYRKVTGRARGRFEQANWAAGRHDTLERLGLYRRSMAQTERELRSLGYIP